jgi:hypothetical protein
VAQYSYQLELPGIDVLVLVHQEVTGPALPVLRNPWGLPQDAAGQQYLIVVIDCAARPENVPVGVADLALPGILWLTSAVLPAPPRLISIFTLMTGHLRRIAHQQQSCPVCLNDSWSGRQALYWFGLNWARVQFG